ncbi:MAG: single-stranded DNA-binding protein [Selenomonadaceae bacterium]|nr:single-stranded DNA-binding protein [Selenomonadaceae bacterium]
MNKAIITGRLTNDAQVRYTQSGKAVASFTVAVDKPNKKNIPQGQPTADFIPCVAWEHNADFISKWFGKGSPILLEGRIQVRQYQAKDGTNRYVTELVVQHAEFNGGNNKQGRGQSANAGQQPYNGNYQEDEEIPF